MTIIHQRLHFLKCLVLLSPHADRHAGDISVTVFCLFFLCLQDFGNRYLGRGLM